MSGTWGPSRQAVVSACIALHSQSHIMTQDDGWAANPSPHWRWAFKDMLCRQHFILSLSAIGQNSVIWEHLAAREATKYSLNSMKSGHLPNWKSVVLLTRKKKGEQMLEVNYHSLPPTHFPTKKDTRKRIPITGTHRRGPQLHNPPGMWGQGSSKTLLSSQGVTSGDASW